MGSSNFESLFFFLPQSVIQPILVTFVFLVLLALLRSDNKKRLEKGETPLPMSIFAYIFYFAFDGIGIQLIVLKLFLLLIMIGLVALLTGKNIERIILVGLVYSLFLGLGIHYAREKSFKAAMDRSFSTLRQEIEAEFNKSLDDLRQKSKTSE